MKIIAIVAMDETRVIGTADNSLPWHIPEDLKLFSQLTKENIVLMGRNTYQSLPEKFRPLPQRVNVVLTSLGEDEFPLPEGVLRFSEVDEAVSTLSRTHPEMKLWVIGGAQVYSSTHQIWDEVYLTYVYGKHTGAHFFPEFEKDFSLVDTTPHEKFEFRRYVRKSA